MKKIFLFFICILAVAALAACAGGSCEHIDNDGDAICDECGDEFIGDDQENGEGEHVHKFVEKKTSATYLVTGATCDKLAKYYYSCSCGEKGSATFESGEYAHLPLDPVVENLVAESCLKEGSYDSVTYCSKCEREVSRENKIIPMNFHTLVDGACSVCGDPESTAGLEFSLNPDGKTYTLVGMGTCTERNIVVGVYNDLSVTNIGKDAFINCQTLETLRLGNSVISIDVIGSLGFSSKLYSISVDEANPVYSSLDGNLYNKDRTELLLYAMGKPNTKFIVPDTVTKIGNNAFSGSYNLIGVYLPDGLTEIDSSAFANCYNINELSIPDSVTSIGLYAFSGCNKIITKQGGVSLVDNWVVDCDANVTSVTLGSKTRGIAYGAFLFAAKVVEFNVAKDCPTLTSIDGDLYSKDEKTLIQYALGKTDEEFEVPDDVEVIGEAAFYGCEAIKKIIISDTVTTIKTGAFALCPNLQRVEISESVSKIETQAFISCASLKEIFVDKENTVYKSVDGNLYSIDGKTLVAYAIGKSAESFQIPSSVEVIAAAAFSNAINLVNIVIPESIIKIEGMAFYLCVNLESIVIPEGVTVISEGLFAACPKLASVVIPKSVTKVEGLAFYSCDALTEVTFGGTVAEWELLGVSLGDECVIKCSDGTLNEDIACPDEDCPDEEIDE